MKRILVTGASGLLGINLALQASSHNDVTGVVYSSKVKGVPFKVLPADLIDPMEIRATVEQANPEVVINCAAMANLEACEKEPEVAERLNTILPLELSEICKKRSIKLVHISTDAVFDGQRGDYAEEDQPNPLSVYAHTKWEGEKAVSSANPNALITRVNFYGFSLNGKRSLAEFFLYNLAAGTRVFGFTDVRFCPLLVQDLVDIIFRMIEKDLKGIYHVVSPESLSKYDFGVRIARIFDLNENLVEPVSVDKGGLQARRSPNLTLRIDKLIYNLRITPSSQESGLNKFHQLFEDGYPEKLRAFISAD